VTFTEGLRRELGRLEQCLRVVRLRQGYGVTCRWIGLRRVWLTRASATRGQPACWWPGEAPLWGARGGTRHRVGARRAKVEARGYGRSNVDAGPHRRSTFGASGEPGAGVLRHCGVSGLCGVARRAKTYCPIRSLTEKTGMLRTATRVVPLHPRLWSPPADLLDDSPRSLMSLFPRSFV